MAKGTLMDRNAIIEICERDALDTASCLFGISKDQLGKFDDYEGCANLVYQFTRDDRPRILRISYRPDHPVELIQAEPRETCALANRRRQLGELKGVRIMNTINPSTTGWLKKGSVFLLFFIVESMVFAIITLSPYLSKNTLFGFHIGITAILLIVTLFLRKSERGKPYWPVFYVFFVAAAAILVSGLFSDDLLRLFKQTVTTPQGIATAKFSESILRVIPILVLTPLMGFDWRSLYLKTGKVRLWLPIAIAAFIFFPLLAYFAISGSQAGMLEKLLPLWPWILLFVLSNGFMEELLYRGLFLQKYESFLGKGLSNILTALVFTIMHTQVTYAPEMIQFLAIAFVLSLIWGALIQKSDRSMGSSAIPFRRRLSDHIWGVRQYVRRPL